MKVNLYLIRETAAAMLLTDEPEQKPTERQYWVPRSLIVYLKKQAPLKSGRAPILVDVPEWKLKQMGLA